VTPARSRRAPAAGRAVAAVALLALAGPVAAADWRVVPAESTIAFAYVLNGNPASGAFREMAGEGTFRPDAPGATRFELRIPVRGLDLGNPLFDAFAQSADWFAAADHPEVVYRLAAVTPLPDGRLEALGDVRVKGRLVVLRTPVSLDLGPDRARARGSIVFDPLAVGVGVGPSALLARLGPEVSVTFDLVARPAAAPPPDGARP
jgi:polyisoprenoid-binding protein YceI